VALFIPYFVLHFLLVNFSWIVFVSECKHIVSNHLNFYVLCDCVVFSILHFSISLLILDLHNKTCEVHECQNFVFAMAMT
jgi:hypothetical protein